MLVAARLKAVAVAVAAGILFASLGAIDDRAAAAEVSAVDLKPVPGEPLASFRVKETYGVRHPDQIIDFDLDRPIDPANCALIGPGGSAVPFQLLDGGKKIAVRTHLPKSLLTHPPYRLEKIGDPQHGAISGVPDWSHSGLQSGDAVRFHGAKLPPALEPEAVYYVVGIQWNDGLFYAFGRTPTGPPVALSGEIRDVVVQRQTFVVEVDKNRIYANDSGLKEGDCIRFRANGQLPAPLVPERAYYACHVAGPYFQIAEQPASGAAKPLTLTSAGTGSSELLIDWHWTLEAGQGPVAASDGVQITEDKTAKCFVITNGLIGVRIPLAVEKAALAGQQIPAPIQGLLLRDGRWTATTHNRMTFPYGTIREMEVRLLERGPLKVTTEVIYHGTRNEVQLAYSGRLASATPGENSITLDEYARLDLWGQAVKKIMFVNTGGNEGSLPKPLVAGLPYYAHQLRERTYQFSETPGGPIIPLTGGVSGKAAIGASYYRGGPGQHSVRITLEAGQPSLLVEEESDLHGYYELNLNGVKLTQARYRGHHSSSVEQGRGPDGKIYAPAHARPEEDAEVDFHLDRNQDHKWVQAWDPWAFDTGWYWQAYDAGGAANSPVIGIFAGRASRALAPNFSGVNFYTRAEASGGPLAGIRATTGLFNPADDKTMIDLPRARYEWGLFMGTKQDVKPAMQIQPIAWQFNLHGGINLNKLQRLNLEFPDPPQGYGAMFMPRAATERLKAKVKTGTPARDKNYDRLRTAYPAEGERAVLALWHEPSAERAAGLVRGAYQRAQDMLHSLVWEDGIFTFHYQYWMGLGPLTNELANLDQVLGCQQATPRDKQQAKTTMLLFSALAWDDDFVPMDNYRGINLGTPNMPVMQASMRNQFAVLLARHPTMKGKVQAAVDTVKQSLASQINDAGAHQASVHYIHASMSNVIPLMQQLKTAGITDCFRGEPKLKKFCEFYMQCTTPWEPRFARRRLISVGDGSTESSELFGMLGTAYADVDPDLSRRLMRIWREQGSKGGVSFMKIDEDLSGSPTHLGSATFPGYMSVLRQGWGTPGESVGWLVGGGFQVDHTHSDQGEVILYALGAPISVDWGSIYSPRIDQAFMHSVALPEKLFSCAWDKDSPPDFGQGSWTSYWGVKTDTEQFQPAAEGGFVRARLSSPDGKHIQWTRALSLAQLGPDLPVIAIQDRYAGDRATGAKIFTLNLMAQGAVQTPSGPVTPVERLWSGDRHELPSAGKVFSLKPGVNRLGFTGQTWPAHRTQGIDWDLYVVSSEQQQAQIGNWAHTSSNDSGDFQPVNGRPFEERQHILRIRAPSGFRVLLVPRLKGQAPQVAVTQEGSRIVVSSGGRVLTIEESGAYTLSGAPIRQTTHSPNGSPKE